MLYGQSFIVSVCFEMQWNFMHITLTFNIRQLLLQIQGQSQYREWHLVMN